MEFLDWAEDHPLPRSLQSRAGWAAFFARRRNPSPHIHQIEPTNQCNCSCIMCPRDRYMTRDIGYMEMDSFQRLIGEISTFPDDIKAKEIELFHFGESLFHPRILDMVHCTSLAGLKPVLSVNPANFSQDQIDRLSGSGPLKIIISLDSLNPDTFKAIRGPGADLHKAVSNTETLLRKSTGNRDTEIVIRMIVMDINQDGNGILPAILAAARDRPGFPGILPVEYRSPGRTRSVQEVSAAYALPIPMAAHGGAMEWRRGAMLPRLQRDHPAGQYCPKLSSGYLERQSV